MEPWKDGVGIDALVQTGQEISEHQSLFPRAVGSHPEPAVAKIVVDEKDVALLKSRRTAKKTC